MPLLRSMASSTRSMACRYIGAALTTTSMSHKRSMVTYRKRSHVQQYVNSLYEAGYNSAKSLAAYEESSSAYEMYHKRSVWLGPAKLADAIAQSSEPLTNDVLDLGAGSGFLGLELKRRGFTHVRAMEPSLEMTKKVPSGTYTAVHRETWTDEARSPIGGTTCSVLAACGVIGTHIGPEGLRALLTFAVQSGGNAYYTIRQDVHEVRCLPRGVSTHRLSSLHRTSSPSSAPITPGKLRAPE